MLFTVFVLYRKKEKLLNKQLEAAVQLELSKCLSLHSSEVPPSVHPFLCLAYLSQSCYLCLPFLSLSLPFSSLPLPSVHSLSFPGTFMSNHPCPSIHPPTVYPFSLPPPPPSFPSLPLSFPKSKTIDSATTTHV